jgi:hypothetical protein
MTHFLPQSNPGHENCVQLTDRNSTQKVLQSIKQIDHFNILQFVAHRRKQVKVTRRQIWRVWGPGRPTDIVLGKETCCYHIIVNRTNFPMNDQSLSTRRVCPPGTDCSLTG